MNFNTIKMYKITKALINTGKGKVNPLQAYVA